MKDLHGLNKCIKVINSCYTEDQFDVAANYCELYIRKVMKDYEYRGFELRGELQELFRKRSSCIM